VEAVATAAALDVEKRDGAVVGSEEPRCRHDRSLQPLHVTGDVERTGARVRHRTRLDRLLIETRTRFAGLPATDRREAEVGAAGLDLDEPAQEPEPLVDEALRTQCDTGGDPRLR
jgi:hypothetical protein